MLISTVCKTHGLSRIRGPILFLHFLFLHPTPVLRTAFTTLLIDTPCRFERRLSTRASGEDTHRSIGSIFDFQPASRNVTELSHPTLRSRSAGRSFESDIVSSDFLCCERAGPSLVDHGVCVKLVAVSRRHQAVYCIQISLSFIITI